MAENDGQGAAGTGTGTPDPKVDPAKVTPAATTTTAAVDDEGFPADLGEAGKKAIRAERTARAKAEKERDDAARERDEFKARSQTDQEKAIDAAKKEGADEATTAANRRIVKSEVRAAASGKVTDPEDAAALLGDLDRFIVKGEVDSKAIEAAIATLVKDKPYLATAGKARPLPGGGATQPSGFSINDAIRDRAGRG